MSALRKDAGFTLVEILASLAILSVMAGTILLMIGQFRHFERQREIREAKIELDRVASHIGRTIEQALKLPLGSRDPGTPADEIPYLVGERDHLRFSAVTRTGSADEGLREIVIRWDQERGVLEEQMPRRSLTRTVVPDRFVVLPNPANLIFGYVAESGVPAQEKWEESGRLPFAITVVISKSLEERDIVSHFVAFLTK